MSLTEIEYGALASSKVLNDNFNYLDSEIAAMSENIEQRVSTFSAQVATLNLSVTNLLSFKSSFIAVGMILPYPSLNLPEGFLSCDGSELLISDFEDLYDVIGKTFGSSDSTTFCLPNLRDKTIWGYGENSIGDYLTSKLPNIKGQFRLQGTEGSSAVLGAFKAGAKGGSWGAGHDNSSYNPLMLFDASTYNAIYDDECAIVQPPALTLNYIIKY